MVDGEAAMRWNFCGADMNVPITGYSTTVHAGIATVQKAG
jgi:hypothetical protein